MKKILTFTTITILLISLFTVAYASEDAERNDMGLRYTYINNAMTAIGISSSGKATISNSIDCYSDVDKITVSTYLQKNVNGTWTTLKHWTDTEYDNDYVGSHSYYVVSDNSYRALTYFYAYDGTQSESTSLTDYEDY